MELDLTQTPPQGHFATINDIQMYYEIHGEGPPLLLLHGYIGSSQQWQPFVSDLARYFRVIVPDLRGHGRSLDPTNGFTLKQATEDILALLQHLEIERCKAIGRSAGGCILLYMNARQPAQLEAVILDSCGSYFSEQTSAALYAWAEVDDAGLEANRNRHRHLQGLSQMRALVNQLPKIVDDYRAHPPDISRFPVKTLIVLGDRDELYSVSMAVEMYTSMPNSYLWIIPDGQHACIINNPDKYAATFIHNALEFLQNG